LEKREIKKNKLENGNFEKINENAKK